MKKNLFIVIIISLLNLFFLCCKSEAQESKTSTKKTETNNTKTTNFNFIPNEPIKGELMGVVELGGSGFNNFIIEIDDDLNWKMKRKEYGASLIVEGTTNSETVNTKLKEYIKNIEAFGVNPNNIHFVVSSGAVKEKIAETIIKELKNIGYVVNIVTAEEEGILALKSVLPQNFSNQSFVIDIGSGNTKITYCQKDAIISQESYGSKYYKKNIEDLVVFEDVKKAASNVPSQKTNNCFIIGGVPYKLAKFIRKSKNRYTKLSTNIKDYNPLIEKGDKKIISGLNIFNAIIEATHTKNVIFDWDANFTIGFLIDVKAKKTN